ncbi:MAG: hypothetical protein AVDCRST_MAG12-2121 [uncultured Rubrobacteraceae bacterium]|uniref:Dienelactone hydrolase domain-containing protein n=1 Tax=uncultured Rubrobacteraceae bacterium TaxID=349277 RepID=A0A6J4SEJ0_9ACTN|nr:MAG: hypothetical protein AVDCRST_MAG12-2121 [uncultured Rubrobacteraceae bacterium]
MAKTEEFDPGRALARRRGTRASVRFAGHGAVLAATMLALLVASCSGGPTEEAANELAGRCGVGDVGVPVEALPYEAGSAEGVDGFVLGGGSEGVIFSNQTDTDLCEWLPLAEEMAGEERRALIYDYSYKPDAAKELAAAAAELERLGVDRVVLVGASKGAVGSLVAAATIEEPSVAGVASLSSVGDFEGLDPREGAGRLDMPLLLMASRDDGGAAEVAREVAKRAPSDEERVEVFGGYDHGTDLLSGGDGPAARELLARFVDGNLSPT